MTAETAVAMLGHGNGGAGGDGSTAATAATAAGRPDLRQRRPRLATAAMAPRCPETPARVGNGRGRPREDRPPAATAAAWLTASSRADGYRAAGQNGEWVGAAVTRQRRRQQRWRRRHQVEPAGPALQAPSPTGDGIGGCRRGRVNGDEHGAEGVSAPRRHV